MAAESFYITININEDEKSKMCETLHFKRIVWYDDDFDLIYKDVLYIDNINNEEGHWWHINACYMNFFYNCEVLYELCQAINVVKPKFEFTVFGKVCIFDFSSLFEFMECIYDPIKRFKDHFEETFGKFSVFPHESFYKFKRKNHKYFIK